MKKVYLLTLLLSSLISFDSLAQTILGLKAGVNLSKENSKSLGTSLESDSKIGLTIGGFAEVNFSESFALQPEINFSQMGGKVENASSTLNYIYFPALAKLKLGALRLFAGPQLGFLISSEVKFNNQVIDSYSNFINDEFSAIGGLEYLIDNKVLINARYQTGLTNVIKESTLVNSQKNNGFSFSVGYRF
jgi:opacity protein-like surface antigen